MISVTEAASKKILSNLAKRGKGVGIRLGVKTTGCSGMAYVLEYVDKPGVDPSVTRDHTVAQYPLLLHPEIGAVMKCKGVQLDKGIPVKEQFYTLPGRQLALFMLLFYSILSATPFHLRLLPSKLFYL